MKKIKLFCSIGLTGCEHEDIYPLEELIDLKEWEKMGEDEQEEFLSQCGLDFLWNYAECGGILTEEEE